MEITHILHSGFLIHDGHTAVVIDYWKEDSPGTLIADLKQNLKPSDTLYVIVSHFHKDHFNPDIFTWHHLLPCRVEYIISHDTARRAKSYFNPRSLYKGPRTTNADAVHILKEYETYADSSISIKAFGSTDTGNSYIIYMAGKIIYHAGDNNAWVWGDNNEEDRLMTKQYTSLLNKIKHHLGTTPINHAMIPVDPRLGNYSKLGAEIFASIFPEAVIHPMHYDNPPY